MTLILGIDTGGTYTDSVIYDLGSEQVVAKAKASTTYRDLTLGIRASIDNLAFDRFSEIKMAALSTTMATNAVVEGRGCEVGVIMIGEKPVRPIPVNHYAVVRGGHDIKGRTREDLDLAEVEQVLAGFKGNVAAIAISGFASVRNPEHELRVKKLVEKKVNLPVVCGHQLTTSLGFHERTVTAALNAQLIPIITDLIAAVKKALAEKGINARLMIVKGDGTLMSEALAVEKPIDTILSGPAASIIGATVLTGESTALVLDMGGTTTDIAIIKNGIPRINGEGARVGGWLTRVAAADINTYGMGGDSYLRVDKDRILRVGPQKVWPLSFAGDQYPYLLDELAEQRKHVPRLRVADAADAYMLIREKDAGFLTETEEKALEILASGPHTLLYLANAMDKNPFSFNLDRLVKKGLVGKVALTPTDLLHVNGTFERWNKEIALLGVNILSDITGKSPWDIIMTAFDSIINHLGLAVLQSVLDFEGAPPETVNNLETNYLINKLFKPEGNYFLDIMAGLNIPIIGIGAPAGAYLPELAEKLKAGLIVPGNADVANAVGAAAGKIMEKIKSVIIPSTEGYVLHSTWERKAFAVLTDAKSYALARAEKQAKLMAAKAGAADYEIMKNCEDIYAKAGAGPYMETRIEVTVIGRPGW